MKNILFNLQGVQASVNLLTVSHIYRNGYEWTLVTSSGSRYTINDEERARIMEAYDNLGKDDVSEELVNKIVEALKPKAE